MQIRSAVRRSIKWKFTLIYVCLITFLLLSIVLVNSFFLESYYTREKVRILENAAQTLDQVILSAERQGRSVSDLLPGRILKELNEKNNVNVVIFDTTSDRVFSVGTDTNFQLRKLSAYIFGSRLDMEEKVIKRFGAFTIERATERESRSMYLECWGYFSDNATSVLMSLPVSSMRESVSFFNRFLLLIGIVVLLLGALIVYVTSMQVTKPINTLAKLSEKMSELDFTARYEGTSEDEIGVLGNSMNLLSERLEEAVGALKTANNELQIDIENKKRIDEKRQEFVANVSHELKTPIALIQGYAEGIQDGMAEDPESRAYYCGVIVDEARKMNRMVRELMNLSSIEQGKDLPDIHRFDLSELVSGEVSAADILNRQKNASVEIDVPEGTFVWADEFKLEEVVNNYLNNALHHLEPPNQISIFSERQKDGSVWLHVLNTGKQIPEEDLDRIWEKFYKVDKAHTRSYGGSGLGLSIVRAIADAHHQKCGVKNTRTGVDFWFSLDGKGRPESTGTAAFYAN